jgi:hypothetical protein
MSKANSGRPTEGEIQASRRKAKRNWTKPGFDQETNGENGAPEALEALPQTSPGGKPPETPGPLSLDPDGRGGKRIVKGSQAAPKRAPLTILFLPRELC